MWREGQFMACFMPKAGCTAWLTYMASELGVDMNLPGRNVYSHYPDHNTRWYPGARCDEFETAQAATPFRFAVVRHPWDRLVSFYHNKFLSQQSGAEFMAELGFGSAWKEWRVQRVSSLPSFHEVVTRIAEVLGENGKGRVPHVSKTCESTYLMKAEPIGCRDKLANAHYRPQSQLCQLDRVRYDMMLDLDQISPAQRENLRRRLGFDHMFPRKEPGSHSGLYLYPCSEATVAAAAKVYALDAQLLGVDFSAMNYTCAVRGHTNYHDVVKSAPPPPLRMPLPHTSWLPMLKWVPEQQTAPPLQRWLPLVILVLVVAFIAFAVDRCWGARERLFARNRARAQIAPINDFPHEDAKHIRFRIRRVGSFWYDRFLASTSLNCRHQYQFTVVHMRE